MEESGSEVVTLEASDTDLEKSAGIEIYFWPLPSGERH
jgi:hypothetical protein